MKSLNRLRLLQQVNLSSNSLSNLCDPNGIAVIRQSLNILDVRFNSFSDTVRTLWSCLPLTNIKQLHLGFNKLVSVEFEIDFDMYQHAVLLDVSFNKLGGQLKLHNIERTRVIFDALGNSTHNVFDCPLPIVPSSKSFQLSKCSPSYGQILTYTLYMAISCFIAGVILFLCKLSQMMWFKRAWSLSLWVFSWLSIANDLRLLFNMIDVVIGERNDCQVVNSRSTFLTFMPVKDFLSFPLLTYQYGFSIPTCPVVFLSPDGPNDAGLASACPSIPCPVTSSPMLLCYWGYDVTNSSPPETQQYASFIQTLNRWNAFSSILNPLHCTGTSNSIVELNNAAFSRLCTRFPRCYVSPANVCSNLYDERNWSTKTHYHFLICVCVLVALRLFYEMAKCGFLFISCRTGRLWQPEWATYYLRTSMLLPLLKFVDIDWWTEVLMADATTSDHLRYFFSHTMLVQVPMLCLTIFYYNTVLQTGFLPLDYISVICGIILTPLALVQACRAYRRSLATDVLKVDALPIDPVELDRVTTPYSLISDQT
jgi:hypothetical protein